MNSWVSKCSRKDYLIHICKKVSQGCSPKRTLETPDLLSITGPVSALVPSQKTFVNGYVVHLPRLSSKAAAAKVIVTVHLAAVPPVAAAAVIVAVIVKAATAAVAVVHDADVVLPAAPPQIAVAHVAPLPEDVTLVVPPLEVVAPEDVALVVLLLEAVVPVIVAVLEVTVEALFVVDREVTAEVL